MDDNGSLWDHLKEFFANYLIFLKIFPTLGWNMQEEYITTPWCKTCSYGSGSIQWTACGLGIDTESWNNGNFYH